jgi:hypothetical protein
MITRISTLAGNAAAQGIADSIDGGAGPGVVRIYGGSMPAGANDPIVSQTLLAELTLSDPCGVVSNKTLTFSPITMDNSADATATATFARVLNSTGASIIDVDVTDTLGNGAMKLNTTSIVATGPVIINSFVITIG